MSRAQIVAELRPRGDSTSTGRWVRRWMPALNAFASGFADRKPTAEGTPTMERHSHR